MSIQHGQQQRPLVCTEFPPSSRAGAEPGSQEELANLLVRVLSSASNKARFLVALLSTLSLIRDEKHWFILIP